MSLGTRKKFLDFHKILYDGVCILYYYNYIILGVI
jgi:hypothetical protein